MLTFDPKFFEPETRLGYFVSEKMKRFWAASLEVLYTVKTIAESNGLTLYADFGTLLGVVRHGGFTPWDDDIDVSMLRPDYQRLMQILPSALPEGYILYDHLGPNTPAGAKAFVSNSVRIETAPDFLKKHHGCPLITGIDIFPIDTVPDDGSLWETQRLLYNAVYDAAQSYDKYLEDGSLGGYLTQLEEALNTKFDYSRDIRNQLWVLSDRVASLFGPDEGSRCCYMADIVTGGERKIREKSWYDYTFYMKYENMELAVPSGYGQLLKSYYGEYMRIHRGGSTHDYPVYGKQDLNRVYMEKSYSRDFPDVCISSPAAGDMHNDKVLFLIRDTSKWGYFADIFDYEKENGADIGVVILPYYYKDDFFERTGNPVTGSADELMAEFRENVIPASEIDIKNERPERTYIQDPFDSYGLSTETVPEFFSGKIRSFTKELLFVIPFDVKVSGKDDEMQKEMLSSYLDTPGAWLSDRVVVFDENFAAFLEQFDSVSGKITLFPCKNPAVKV